MAAFLGRRHARLVHLGLWLPVTWLVMIWRMPWDRIRHVLSPLGSQDDVQDLIEAVKDDPNIWSDESVEPIAHLDFEVAGAGVFHSCSS